MPKLPLPQPARVVERDLQAELDAEMQAERRALIEKERARRRPALQDPSVAAPVLEPGPIEEDVVSKQAIPAPPELRERKRSGPEKWQVRLAELQAKSSGFATTGVRMTVVEQNELKSLLRKSEAWRAENYEIRKAQAESAVDTEADKARNQMAIAMAHYGSLSSYDMPIWPATENVMRYIANTKERPVENWADQFVDLYGRVDFINDLVSMARPSRPMALSCMLNVLEVIVKHGGREAKQKAVNYLQGVQLAYTATVKEEMVKISAESEKKERRLVAGPMTLAELRDDIAETKFERVDMEITTADGKENREERKNDD